MAYRMAVMVGHVFGSRVIQIIEHCVHCTQNHAFYARVKSSFRCALNQNFQLWRASSLGMLHYVFINFLLIEKCIRELCSVSIDFVFVGRVIKHFSMYAVHEYKMVDGWNHVKISETFEIKSNWLDRFHLFHRPCEIFLVAGKFSQQLDVWSESFGSSPGFNAPVLPVFCWFKQCQSFQTLSKKQKKKTKWKKQLISKWTHRTKSQRKATEQWNIRFLHLNSTKCYFCPSHLSILRGSNNVKPSMKYQLYHHFNQRK